MQVIEYGGITDEAVSRCDESRAWRSKPFYFSSLVSLGQGCGGPLKPAGVGNELSSIQGWQGEAREEGAGIHVVLHNRTGQKDIPLFESWIGGAGHARKQQKIDVGR